MIDTPTTVEAIEVPFVEHEDLVFRAQRGDTAAAERLYRGFVGYLRAEAVRYEKTVDFDEALSVASAAYAEAVSKYDRRNGASLVGLVGRYVKSALTDAGRQNGGSSGVSVLVSVPERTLKRFFSILDKADGDPEVGAEIAPANDMARGTFEDIYVKIHDAATIVDDAGDLEGATAEGVRLDRHKNGGHVRGGYKGSRVWGEALADPAPATEDVAVETLLLEHAWSAVDEAEADTLRMYYGFDGEEMSDSAIAAATDRSRPAVQRTRDRALRKMRAELGIDALSDSREDVEARAAEWVEIASKRTAAVLGDFGVSDFEAAIRVGLHVEDVRRERDVLRDGLLACGCDEEAHSTADRWLDAPLPLHRTEAGWPHCATCEGGGCLDCTDPA